MANIVKVRKYSYMELMKDTKILKKTFKDLKISSIGRSTMGKEIIYFRLGNGKKSVMINATHHANEWQTSLVIMLFVEKYLYEKEKGIFYKGFNLTELWNDVSLYIVPMVNPDGVDLVTEKIKKDSIYYKKCADISAKYSSIPFPSGWKANINGVDFINFHFLFFKK